MKTNILKLFFVFSLLLNFNSTTAQKLSYGVILGINFFNDQSSNGGPNDVFFDSGNDQFIVPNLGGYLEYEATQNIGLKLELTANTKTFEKGYANKSLGEQYKLSFIDFNPNFKYDFGSEYRKGFYMILGPKIAVLTKASFNSQNVTSDFEKVTLGLELGLGQRMLKFLEIEGKFDYGLTPFYKANGSKPNKIAGFYLSLHVDLQKIISSK
ncbi:PorT family protein [Flavobacterium sp. SM15]|uniref:outer membrane beta-barrel protein n=1 Tax=Flavobacterium sp. SM15 TaxID=2908005 RepID=UPI001EDB1D42|nr:outer membrane beta-barrel protein [Flavobacterium sp. SM15]MCG2611982.1 PorT family protein [Flavobacterium sp. SM15]